MSTNINENKIKIIEKLLPNLKLNLINLEVIDNNIQTLSKLFENITKIYFQLPSKNDHEDDITNPKLKKTILNHINSFISGINSSKLDELKTWNKVFSLTYNNLHFFYLYNTDSHLKKDFDKIDHLAKIFFSLAQFFNLNSEQTRYVIWLPIDTDRDYLYDRINNNNLDNSKNDFKAFTVSGVTYGGDRSPRITIITRYEEIDKLLIHELIHNLHLDGSNYHQQLTSIISKYNKVKKNRNYNYEFSIYESFTEMLSTYLYLLYKNIDKPVSEIKTLLLGQILIEIIYSYNTIVNLAKLNGYNDYSEFIIKQEFLGSICFYEYYYIKGLLYNHLILVFPRDLQGFIKLYEDIIQIIENSSSDKLLKNMFRIYKKQKNFKYIFN